MSVMRDKGLVLAMALLVFFSGCTGYRVSHLPLSDSSRSTAASEEFVKAGQMARIVLKSGDIVEGEVTVANSDSLVVGVIGNYGFEESVVLAADIIRIEVEANSLSGSIAAGLVGAAAVGVLFAVTAERVTEPQELIAK
jgi:hypothetical protein